MNEGASGPESQSSSKWSRIKPFVRGMLSAGMNPADTAMQARTLVDAKAISPRSTESNQPLERRSTEFAAILEPFTHLQETLELTEAERAFFKDRLDSHLVYELSQLPTYYDFQNKKEKQMDDKTRQLLLQTYFRPHRSSDLFDEKRIELEGELDSAAKVSMDLLKPFLKKDNILRSVAGDLLAHNQDEHPALRSLYAALNHTSYQIAEEIEDAFMDNSRIQRYKTVLDQLRGEQK